MAIYRYIVTVETGEPRATSAMGHNIAGEIDSNLESVINSELDIEHFTVEQAPIGYWPGQGFVESSLREGQNDV